MRRGLLFAALLLSFGAACARRATPGVKPGSYVKLDYTLFVDGKPFESTEIHGPIEIIQGKGGVPDAVDRALLGMLPGQQGDVEIPAGLGFGYRDEKKIESLPLAGMGAVAEGLKAGNKILGLKNGKSVEGRVLEVKDGVARVDFNHPLADKALRYKFQVVEVDPVQ